MKSTFEDPILADLYAFREQHAEAFRYDISAMMEELIREQAELEKQGRRFAAYSPQRCQPEFPYMPINEGTLGTTPPVGVPAAHPDSPTAAE